MSGDNRQKCCRGNCISSAAPCPAVTWGLTAAEQCGQSNIYTGPTFTLPIVNNGTFTINGALDDILVLIQASDDITCTSVGRINTYTFPPHCVVFVRTSGDYSVGGGCWNEKFFSNSADAITDPHSPGPAVWAPPQATITSLGQPISDGLLSRFGWDNGNCSADVKLIYIVSGSGGVNITGVDCILPGDCCSVVTTPLTVSVPLQYTSPPATLTATGNLTRSGTDPCVYTGYAYHGSGVGLLSVTQTFVQNANKTWATYGVFTSGGENDAAGTYLNGNAASPIQLGNLACVGGAPTFSGTLTYTLSGGAQTQQLLLSF